MKPVYDDSWPPAFLNKLEELRRLDEKSQREPLYIEYLDKLHNAITVRLLTALSKRFGDVSALHISADEALLYLSGEITSDVFAFIESFAKYECQAIKIAHRQYGKTYFFYALMVLKNNDELARYFSKQMIRPAVISYRDRQSARQRGRRGGRPVHRLKSEALELAEILRAQQPWAEPGEISKHIADELNAKYSDAPTLSAIKKWIING
ncbi:hypothetical protein ETB55_21920 [Salmonella enterica subsp. enterica serovar Omuna]|nr:hypothetical protein [Salmonella enterica subsp. enterica serovar Omuna]